MSLLLCIETNAENDLRVYRFPNHLIFYRSKDDMLQILRVLHGARDYETIFNDNV
ncbi:MAG: type II toxin-antitoxin system RelE/ParE family toxin [Planctomycetaceae bacterium]|nr:type II toxin-antitoxin system RelE/ParE family toxin [Planctomycetaceae bacterium]